MNEQSNAPMSAGPNAPSSFFQIWINALTKPNEQTYAAIATSPDASPGKAYLWVFFAALINFAISIGIQTMYLGISEGSQDGGLASMLGGSILALLCAVPVLAGLQLLGFMIITAIV